MPPEDFDDEGFEDFLNESRELLDDLQPVLLELEQNPDNLDLVEEPFRILHSIKGMSSFFGLTPIKRISHALEDLLSDIRDGQLEVSGDVVDILFRGSERLEEFYETIFDGHYDIELSAEDEELFDEIKNLEASAAGVEERFREFVSEVEDCATRLPENEDSVLQELTGKVSEVREYLRQRDDSDEGEENEKKYPDSIFPEHAIYRENDIGGPLSTLESICRETVEEDRDHLPDDDLENYKENFEELWDMATENEWDEVLPVLEEMRNEYDRFMETAGFGSLLADSFLKHLHDLEMSLAYETPVSSPAEDTPGADPETNGVSRTFRVEEGKVDNFMEYVGELIVTGEMYKHIEEELKLEDIKTELKEQVRSTNHAFRTLSNDLRESLMDVRRLRVNNLLKKFPVMVRKLSRDLEKEIDVVLEGEDIHVDKIFVEELETPLTHLVRNSVDHGIEPPDERREKGKDPTGTIKLSVEDADESIKFTIEDDGAGLDVDRIREKILEQNLANESELKNQSSDELFQYIFRSGFSTTDDVDDVSGRGVGMNDVQETINRLNGTIDVHSDPDEGTKFTLEVPRSQSVNVLDALVIHVGDQQFALPLERILESFITSSLDIKSVEGSREMVEVRDAVHPVYRIRELFDLEHSSSSKDEDVLLLLEDEGEKFAILADRLGEQQKVVLKDMGPIFSGIGYASGAAVMGDGSVCLVLDVHELGENARNLTSQGTDRSS